MAYLYRGGGAQGLLLVRGFASVRMYGAQLLEAEELLDLGGLKPFLDHKNRIGKHNIRSIHVLQLWELLRCPLNKKATLNEKVVLKGLGFGQRLGNEDP